VYRVITETTALADIAHHYRYLLDHAHAADYPDVWFDAIVVAILGLRDFPLSFGLVPENAEFEEEIRHHLEGSYRVIFSVQEDRVHVPHVRHARQEVLR